MSDPTRLLLVRHAAVCDELRGRCYGRLDPPLSSAGRREARRLARALAASPVAAVYASPARRAVDTASPIAARHGLTPAVEDALAELDFGSFEGRSYDELERDEPELYHRFMDEPTAVAFPGGESYPQLRRRVLGAVEGIRARHRGECAVVVSHAGPLRAILAECLALPDDAIFRLELACASVSVVEWTGATPSVRLLGRAGDDDALALPAAAPRLRPERPAAGAGRLARPPLPSGFDDSRARARRDRPDGWRFADPERAGVWRAILERRDIRRFRPDPLDDALVERLLDAARRAPSVGLMQPWRFVLVRSEETKAAMQALAARERLVQAERFDERTRLYLDLKLEGIREAPLGICVCCDRSAGGGDVLGRHTIPDTDLYSTCLAIENLWLVARAEGVGVGWVSFYRPDDLRALLGLPEHVVPVAWLCVGFPDERPTRPGLEAAGWGRRRRLDELVHAERWVEPRAGTGAEGSPPPPAGHSNGGPEWWRRLAAAVVPGDPGEALRARDASDELVKPAGSLGALELVVERFAMAAHAPPPPAPRAGILVLAADHGVARRGVSLYPGRVGGQVAAAAARGETAVGVLARALGAELVVADVGLRGAKLPGVVDARVADGSRDITRGPALTPGELRAAVEAGYGLARDLAARCDLIVPGEIGIGNTTVAAALLAALTGLEPARVCGRGTGLDAQGVARKQRAVAAALEANGADRADPLECLRRVGGVELAALGGALLGAASLRRPILLDGFATGVAALVACRLQPALRDYLIAGHRSAEPAHGVVLTELGLEPLLDLRLRLGEGSGAALALPLVGLAARLHAEMGSFDDAGVERAAPSGGARRRSSAPPGEAKGTPRGSRSAPRPPR